MLCLVIDIHLPFSFYFFSYMATSGMDGLLKIWDIRMYKSLHAHRLRRAAHSLSISQKGQLAVGFGPHVYVCSFLFLLE